jgi:ribosomal protein L37AE/L43A
MAAEMEGPESTPANGVAEQHLPNGTLENGDVEHHGSKTKLTAAEKKKLKKKQRKINKQQERQGPCPSCSHDASRELSTAEWIRQESQSRDGAFRSVVLPAAAVQDGQASVVSRVPRPAPTIPMGEWKLQMCEKWLPGSH